VSSVKCGTKPICPATPGGTRPQGQGNFWSMRLFSSEGLKIWQSLGSGWGLLGLDLRGLLFHPGYPPVLLRLSGIPLQIVTITDTLYPSLKNAVQLRAHVSFPLPPSSGPDGGPGAVSLNSNQLRQRCRRPAFAPTPTGLPPRDPRLLTRGTILALYLSCVQE
jgi:hypothetical protein